ncbi:MAG: rRNA pseudouridine synthase, partial [Atopobiaceae bacterium]|nr:rRNA pseudouridine synthase [Atopobiaceae bacterium]
LLHPSHHVWKHYVALVRGIPTEAELDRIRHGIELEDGPAAPAEVNLMGRKDPAAAPVIPKGLPRGHAVVGLSIHEGRKHQVKRMMEAIGHEVVRLHRDEFGPLRLVNVKPGHWRELTDEERAAISNL